MGEQWDEMIRRDLRGVDGGGGGDELDSSMLSSSSRLRTWLVGAGHIMHPCIL